MANEQAPEEKKVKGEMARFKAVEGKEDLCGFALHGKTYSVDKDGILEAPLSLSKEVQRHGFVLVAEGKKKK